MAALRLESYDDNVLELPDLCLKCGAPATMRRNKRFSWCPQWIWVFIFCGGWPVVLILMLVLTKRRRVEVPLCDEHKNHWLMRQIIVVSSLLVLLAVGFVALIVQTDNQPGNDSLSSFVCVGWLVAMVVWLIVAAILQATSIRTNQITDTSITLVGVSKVFVEAYEDESRPATERLDELASERWNQGKRSPRTKRLPDEDTDSIQRAEEDENRPSPPDSYRK